MGGCNSNSGKNMPMEKSPSHKEGKMHGHKHKHDHHRHDHSTADHHKRQEFKHDHHTDEHYQHYERGKSRGGKPHRHHHHYHAGPKRDNLRHPRHRGAHIKRIDGGVRGKYGGFRPKNDDDLPRTGRGTSGRSRGFRPIHEKKLPRRNRWYQQLREPEENIFAADKRNKLPRRGDEAGTSVDLGMDTSKKKKKRKKLGPRDVRDISKEKEYLQQRYYYGAEPYRKKGARRVRLFNRRKETEIADEPKLGSPHQGLKRKLQAQERYFSRLRHYYYYEPKNRKPKPNKPKELQDEEDEAEIKMTEKDDFVKPTNISYRVSREIWEHTPENEMPGHVAKEIELYDRREAAKAQHDRVHGLLKDNDDLRQPVIFQQSHGYAPYRPTTQEVQRQKRRQYEQAVTPTLGFLSNQPQKRPEWGKTGTKVALANRNFQKHAGQIERETVVKQNIFGSLLTSVARKAIGEEKHRVDVNRKAQVTRRDVHDLLDD